MISNAIIFDKSKCNGCGVCVLNCPEIVFQQQREKAIPAVAHPNRCMGCMACEEDCAHGAIKVYRLPDGLDADNVTPPAAGLDPDRVYDIVIIGAGPAGIGAAIRGRLLGLDVAVIERLPSRKRSHHPDGGLLFWDKYMYRITDDAKGITIPELGINIPTSAICERIENFIFMGPGGLATKRSEKGKHSFPSVSKDRFVEILSSRALELGAVIAYNTRALKISRDTASGLSAVTVDGGLEIKGKVVISAEGNTGKLTERAGVPVNKNKVGWGFALLKEQEPLLKPPGEAGFLMGKMEGLEEDAKFLSYWSGGTGKVELATGPIQLEKKRILENPLDYYFEHFTRKDLRAVNRLGTLVADRKATLRDGCRILARRLPDKAVGDGLIAVGDAITTCGMMTNIMALKSGDLAAEVAAKAISLGDTSAKMLEPFEKRVFKIPMVKGMSWMHGLLIEAPLRLPENDLALLFGGLKHLNLSKTMGGGLGAVWEMSKFMLRIMPLMMKRKDLVPYIDGSGGPK